MAHAPDQVRLAALPGRGSTSPLGEPPPAAQTDAEGVLEVTWRIVRRRWLTVLQGMVITALLAYGYALTKPKEYSATSSVLFGTASESVLNTNTGYVDANRRAATNESLLRLSNVADATAKTLNNRISAGEIAAAIEIAGNPNADLVDVTATTVNPELSAAVANAYARAFIERRRREATNQIQNAIDGAKVGRAQLTPVQRSGSEGRAIDDRIQQLETAKALQTGGAELVQEAGPPGAPSAPSPKRNGILGAMLGAILGFGIAALRERRDRAIKTVDELESVSRWPVLSRVPISPSLRDGTPLPPRGAEAEAYRMLRANLRYVGFESEVRSLLVTSALPSEGKSTTAWRFAETMAQMGDHVVLVEADMRRSPEYARGDVTPAGLSGVLTGLDLSAALVEIPVGDPEDGRFLSVLRAGPLPPNPSELLESERMRALMESLQAHFETVIVDSPPLPVLSDTISLVSQVSGIVIVTALGRTTAEDVRELGNQLSRLDARVFGIVANFAPGVTKRSEGYYYQR